MYIISGEIFLFGVIFLVKISKHIYIHFSTVALFAACYVMRTLEALAAVYAVMLLHEGAHALAAAGLGLGISHVELYPFGVALKVKSRVLCSISDELILYLSGPLVNAAAALVSALCGFRGIFFVNNILLFAVNLLPVLPLDGGQLLYGIMWNYLGEARAHRLTRVVSVLTGSIFFTAVWIFAGLNINTVMLCGFVAAGIFTQKPKYSRDLARTLAVRKKTGKVNRCNVISAREGAKYTDIVKKLVPRYDTLIVFYAPDGSIDRAETDEELIQKLLS